jgi:hypothetical protein
MMKFVPARSSLSRVLRSGTLAFVLLTRISTQAPARTIGGTGQAEQFSLEASLTTVERSELLRGKIVLRELPNPGRPGRTFEALGLLPCGLDEAFAVITDFRRYAEIMPHVKRAVVKTEDGAGCVVEIRLSLPLGQSRRYQLRFESAKADGEFLVFWQKVPWPELRPGETIKDTSGRWRVQQFTGGGLLASYLVYADPSPVPLGLTGLAAVFGKRSLPDVIEKVRRRIRTLQPPEKDRPRS